jgi:hypothetical protein
MEAAADINAAVHYLKDAKGVLKRLQDLQGQVALINKEEALFEWEQSSYPAISELLTRCEPFHALFGAIVDWQKSLRKYIPGR